MIPGLIGNKSSEEYIQVDPPPEPYSQETSTRHTRSSTSANPKTKSSAAQTPAPKSKSQDDTVTVNPSKKQKLTSGVWEHFTKIGAALQENLLQLPSVDMQANPIQLPLLLSS
ncbi:hypothetical protein PCANC_03203 [Puccinia coronata f. sp. avenae]|uniref:Uncharacterized protein n=1 Tax=Puccinia coronata f. sp. avenae TaxID=200324 RepID=A0A2N5T8C9_9BASI|nr:hypothetical protein PCANC_03203 [Puccinia coronata f. sp. avenae]